MIIEGWIEYKAPILLFEPADLPQLLLVFIVCVAQSDNLLWRIIIIRHHFDIVIREIPPFSVAERPYPPPILSFFLDCDHIADVKSKIFLLLRGESVPGNGSFFWHSAVFEEVHGWRVELGGRLLVPRAVLNLHEGLEAERDAGIFIELIIDIVIKVRY